MCKHSSSPIKSKKKYFVHAEKAHTHTETMRPFNHNLQYLMSQFFSLLWHKETRKWKKNEKITARNNLHSIQLGWWRQSHQRGWRHRMRSVHISSSAAAAQHLHMFCIHNSICAIACALHIAINFSFRIFFFYFSSIQTAVIHNQESYCSRMITSSAHRVC